MAVRYEIPCAILLDKHMSFLITIPWQDTNTLVVEARQRAPRDGGDAPVPHPEPGGLREIQQNLRVDPAARAQAVAAGTARPSAPAAREAAAREAHGHGHPGDDDGGRAAEGQRPGDQGDGGGGVPAPAAGGDVQAQDGADGGGRDDVHRARPRAHRAADRDRPRVPGHPQHGGLFDVGRFEQD